MEDPFVETPSDGGPSNHTHHVLLLMPDTEDRRLLEGWLGQRYTVTARSTPESLDREFDLCLVNESIFARHTAALVERKARDAPVFVPYLLVLEDRAPGDLDQRIWEHVDEIVTTPIEKAELQGRLTGLLVRRDLSKALAAREERIRRILRTIPDPLIIIDETGTVVQTNPALGDHMGCDDEDVIGSDIADLEALPPATAERLMELAAAADPSVTEGPSDEPAADGRDTEPLTGGPTLVYRSEEGPLRYAEAGVAPLAGPRTADRQTLFVLRDVTERRTRKRALERERDRLDDFADMLAHEVRNPLNIAQGFLEEITADDEREEAALDRVVSSHTRMEQMVKELLAHTRGDLTRDLRPVNLARIARVAWDQTPTGEMTLDLPSEDTTVEADPENFRTILENLFRNAMEHAESATTVRVGPLEDGGFYVADDGRGIPPEDRETVFERGYTTNSAGTGLGLALVRQVADAHGWESRVTESRDGGARFEFRDRPTADRASGGDTDP